MADNLELKYISSTIIFLTIINALIAFILPFIMVNQLFFGIISGIIIGILVYFSLNFCISLMKRIEVTSNKFIVLMSIIVISYTLFSSIMFPPTLFLLSDRIQLYQELSIDELYPPDVFISTNLDLVLVTVGIFYLITISLGFFTSISIPIRIRRQYKCDLMNKYGAPDFNTAKLIQVSSFPDYHTYHQAQSLGLQSLNQLRLIQKYQTSNLATAKKMYINECEDELLKTLDNEGKVIFNVFFRKHKIEDISKSVFTKLINDRAISGIHTTDWEVFLTVDFVKSQLQEAAKVYSDISFDILIKSFGVPKKYILEILSEIIKTGLATGKIDRLNQKFIFHDISASIPDKLAAGESVPLKLIQSSYQTPLSETLADLRNYLPSKEYILSYQDSKISIEPIKVSCQICFSTNTFDKLLKCNECDRDLCWEHFQGLSEVGRPVCPFCDGSLNFLPKHCETCHLSYIKIAENRNSCEICGNPLTIQEHLKEYYEEFQSIQKRFKNLEITNDDATTQLKKDN